MVRLKTLKPLIVKRSDKHDRERKVLLGLIEHYLKSGKPVGSNTLKESGFEDLSSATIRNYFANLEKEGYLTQQHSSGGRIPTAKAFRLYAHENVEVQVALPPATEKALHTLREKETREIAAYLQNGAETLSSLTQLAVFLSAPRFDRDFIIDLKLVGIDHTRCLCIIITNFGVIETEVLPIENKLSAFAIKRIENYFHWRLTGYNQPKNLNEEEEQLASKLYNEVMLRYIVSYSNFSDEEIYRTGFSKLLTYPEFQDPNVLANSLTLFENIHSMRLLLKECNKTNQLKFWIGEDLATYSTESPDCVVIAIPYYVNRQPVGAIGILGPVRINYRSLFSLMREFSESISAALTRNIYKFKISFRQPQPGTLDMQMEKQRMLSHSRLILLEDKRNN